MQQQSLPIGGVNSNVPQQAVFNGLLADARITFATPNALQLSGIAFGIGEKLARFRLAQFPADAITLAELKAVYGILTHQHGLVFFRSHADMDYDALLDLVSGILDDDTPADVAVMMDVYNAVWSLHYRQFEKDPASALAEWNVEDSFQTRAVRAVLFDMPFSRVLHLSLAIVESCLDVGQHGASKDIVETINKKRALVLNILLNRKEAETILPKTLGQRSAEKQAHALRQAIEFLQRK
ncbi:MAG: hypothetical protein ACK5O1_06505 [Holosporales bacterium]|jgi:hypothetical protein